MGAFPSRDGEPLCPACRGGSLPEKCKTWSFADCSAWGGAHLAALTLGGTLALPSGGAGNLQGRGGYPKALLCRQPQPLQGLLDHGSIML